MENHLTPFSPPPVLMVRGHPACWEGQGLTWYHLVYAPQEEVGQEGEERGVEAIDCRKVGQQSKCHACRG